MSVLSASTTTTDENSASRERDELQFVLDAMRPYHLATTAETRRSDDTSDTTTGGAHEYEQSDE